MARRGPRRPHLLILLLWAWIAAAPIYPSTAFAAPGATKAEDPRLSQSVTLDLMQVPLSDLCGVMERRTGVAHRPADAATGDLLVDAVGTLTVAQLHQAVAAVLGVDWKRSGKGKAAGYVVEIPPAQRMEEAREQAEADQAYSEGLRRLLAAANTPDAAQWQLPWRLQRDFGPGHRDAVQLLDDLTPAERAQVMAGAGVQRRVASLWPEGQARVKTIVQSLEQSLNEAADERMAASSQAGEPKLRRRKQPRDLQDGEDWQIQFTRSDQRMGAGTAIYMVVVSSPNDPGLGLGISVPATPPTRPGPVDFRMTINGAGPGNRADPDTRRSAPDSAHALFPGDPVPPGKTWEEIARELARRLGCPVVSDAYRPIEIVFRAIEAARDDESLESYLDRACRFALNRRWGRVGPVLLFQRRDWATQRRAQIPESQVQRWKQHIIDTGRVSLDPLVEMAALTPYQLPNLGDVIGRPADQVTENQELLQLWGALPAAQRSALRGEGRVIRDLPLAVQPRARALVSGMLGMSAAGEAPLVLASAKLRVEQTAEAFTFSVVSPGRPAVVRRVELTCPPWWREMLRKDAEARAAALRAAGEPVQSSLYRAQMRGVV